MGTDGSFPPEQTEKHIWNNSSIEPALLHALATAESAAQAASSYLLKKLGQSKITRQKGPFDDLFDVDLEAERIILDHLKQHFPSLGFLSEEAGDFRQGGDSFWVVDPVDGSSNFSRGQTSFAVAIGLVWHTQFVLGVISLPMQQEMFTALHGWGAFLNGSPIHVSSIDHLSQSVIHFGEFERNEHQVSRQQLQELTTLSDQCKRVRIYGSSAYDLVSTACGRDDALIMHGPGGGNPWDVWAGRLILEEAGGRSSLHPSADGHTLAIYSNGRIHDQLVHLLA